MKPFLMELDLQEALNLWLRLAPPKEGEAEKGGLARIRELLRIYLYEHLSIAEMEDAERQNRLRGSSAGSDRPVARQADAWQ